MHVGLFVMSVLCSLSFYSWSVFVHNTGLCFLCCTKVSDVHFLNLEFVTSHNIDFIKDINFYHCVRGITFLIPFYLSSKPYISNFSPRCILVDRCNLMSVENNASSNKINYCSEVLW